MKFLACFTGTGTVKGTVKGLYGKGNFDAVINIENCEKLTSFYVDLIRKELHETGYENVVFTNIIPLEQ